MFNIDWRDTILILPALLFGFAIHEYAHARVAVALGDMTPKRQGRLTLSPIAHIDPFGLLLFIFAHFGWAKPVQIDPTAFKNPKRDDLLVTIAGPLANLVSAIFFALLTRLILFFNPNVYLGSFGSVLFDVITYFVWTNLALTIFNLVPFPPLDGSHLLLALLPNHLQHIKEGLIRYGGIILIAIIFIGNSSGIDILPIGPAVKFVYNGLLGVLGVWNFV